MAGATITHGRRGESALAALNLAHLALAAFPAWGRRSLALHLERDRISTIRLIGNPGKPLNISPIADE
ncbi:hypothetical protein [Streptomyces niveiscabiei]|uniref:hypothetical protein n=1 Tax=Streptomyces niveiscabiei TaxID=164115 RepID=UPI0029CA7388|nr:hypothetical protein [Streptomyces niveiscabiei]